MEIFIEMWSMCGPFANHERTPMSQKDKILNAAWFYLNGIDFDKCLMIEVLIDKKIHKTVHRYIKEENFYKTMSIISTPSL